jgi:hypothetical protein
MVTRVPERVRSKSTDSASLHMIAIPVPKPGPASRWTVPRSAIEMIRLPQLIAV